MSSWIIGTVFAALILGAAVLFVRRRSSPNAEAPPIPSDFPPKPKWKPDVPVDVDRIEQVFAYYSNEKRKFAIFRHGTCVLIDDSSPDAEAEAKRLLDAVYNFHPDFDPQPMDDGNWMVEYSQPVLSVVLKSEVEANWGYIDANHMDGVVRDEVLLNAQGEPNRFDRLAKVGLFARARMFLDAQEPDIVRVHHPPR